jgi:hypothetical protein
MAIEKVIDIKVQGNADQAVGSLRSQLREAQAEVAALSDKFGATSQAAVEAAKKAGELKDRIGDAKALTDAFNPDAKFKSLTASLSGVAGGFAAVQGGMALFGAQSENVQATLLKVQSAMALSQGIQALGEARDSFRQLGAVANDVFKSIKAAIGSTGIGLLVVALAAVVTYWDEIAEAIDGATDESKAYKAVQDQVTASIAKVEENLINVKIAIDQAKAGTISKEAALKKYNETLGTAFGKTDDLRVAEERMIANTENYVKAQTLRAAGNLMIAKGAEAAAKAASGEDKDLSFWQQAQSEILGTISISEKYASRAKSEIQNRVENAKEQAKYTTLGTNLLNEAAQLEVKIGAEKNNKIYEQNQKLQKEKDKNAETDKERNERLYKEYLKTLPEIDPANIEAELSAIDAKNQAKRDKDTKFKEDQIAAETQQELLIAQIQYDSEAAQEERRKEAQEKRIKDFQDTTEAVGSIAQSGENLLAAIQANGLAKGKAGQAAMKALALVQIGVDSAIAFSKMMQGTEQSAAGAASGAPGPAAPAVYLATKIAFYVSGTATILANIARAKALLSGGGGGGGGAVAAPSVGGGGTMAPQFNVVGATGVNQLAGVMGAQQQTPVQTYVVANNVSTAMALDRNIIQSATLGG